MCARCPKCQFFRPKTPVDPAGGYWYRTPTKPWKSRDPVYGGPADGSVTRR